MESVSERSSRSTTTVTAEAKRLFRVLIVEDDLTVEPIWDVILRRAIDNVGYRWVTTEHAAEEILRARRGAKEPEFDLVISDVFLSGPKTGIDLWERFQSSFPGRFILVSGIDRTKLDWYLPKNHERPLYLRKPLNVKEAVEIIHTAIMRSAS